MVKILFVLGSSLFFVPPAPAAGWRADVCRTYLLTAGADRLQAGDLDGLGAVTLFDDTFEGEDGIARFFANFDAALSSDNVYRSSRVSGGWREYLKSAGRVFRDDTYYLAAGLDVALLATFGNMLLAYEHLQRPTLAVPAYLSTAIVGSVDYPLRFAWSFDWGRTKFQWAASKFRRGQSPSLDWSYRARVSEAYARTMAEGRLPTHAEVGGENRRELTAAVWRLLLRPESRRHRYVNVMITGDREAWPPRVRLHIALTRD